MYRMYMYAFTTKNQVSESLLRGDHSRLFSLSKCELHLNESMGGGGGTGGLPIASDNP